MLKSLVDRIDQKEVLFDFSHRNVHDYKADKSNITSKKIREHISTPGEKYRDYNDSFEEIDFSPRFEERKMTSAIDPNFRFVVSETEKMGQKLTQEIQRQRLEISKYKEQNSSLTNLVRQIQSDLDDAKSTLNTAESVKLEMEARIRAATHEATIILKEKEHMLKEMVVI